MSTLLVKTKTRPINNLDILRSFAVLIVVTAHSIAVTNLRGAGGIENRLGRLGVLFFFVHTALVLMMSMQRSQGRRWVTRFYISRVFRIYPLSILCVAAVLFFRVPPILNKLFVSPSIPNFIANLALIQNLPGFSSVSGPMWSLPFEVQMYLLLPFIFVMVRRYGSRGAAVISALAVVIAFLDMGLRGPRMAQFFPCFMGGVLAYSNLNRKAIIPAWLWPASLITILVIGYASGISPLIQWCICLTLGAIIPAYKDFADGCISKLAHTIARYSYGIYLCHMPLRWLCFQRLDVPTCIRWMAYILLVPAVSFLLYHLIESPMIRIGRGLSLRLAASQEIKVKLPPPPADGAATMIENA
jgi:peptidoglycan/LPS O-acetylase OafA/YrhL